MRSGGLRVMRADVQTDNDGKSKGYGIVEFSSPREAREAIENLNDTELKGRKIYVREDREVKKANEPVGSRTVLVSNLPPGYSWKSLKDVTSQAGDVIRADVIFQDGRTYGVVEFVSVVDAKKAISRLNNVNIDQYIVTLAFQQGVAVTENNNNNHYNTTNNVITTNKVHRDVPVDCKLYVAQLAWGVSWQDLKDHFKQIGTVIRADVALEGDSRRSKGYGFVEFENSDDAARAVMELHDSDLKGRRITVRQYRED